jgi:hypothetical protein
MLNSNSLYEENLKLQVQIAAMRKVLVQNLADFKNINTSGLWNGGSFDYAVQSTASALDQYASKHYEERTELLYDGLREIVDTDYNHPLARIAAETLLEVRAHDSRYRSQFEQLVQTPDL